MARVDKISASHPFTVSCFSPFNLPPSFPFCFTDSPIHLFTDSPFFPLTPNASPLTSLSPLHPLLLFSLHLSPFTLHFSRLTPNASQFSHPSRLYHRFTIFCFSFYRFTDSPTHRPLFFRFTLHFSPFTPNASRLTPNASRLFHRFTLFCFFPFTFHLSPFTFHASRFCTASPFLLFSLHFSPPSRLCHPFTLFLFSLFPFTFHPSLLPPTLFRRLTTNSPLRRSACQRSYCTCWFSQLSGVVSKAMESLIAISGLMRVCPLRMLDSVVRLIPRAPAASVIDRPSGSRHNVFMISPGCGGLCICISDSPRNLLFRHYCQQSEK